MTQDGVKYSTLIQLNHQYEQEFLKAVAKAFEIEMPIRGGGTKNPSENRKEYESELVEPSHSSTEAYSLIGATKSDENRIGLNTPPIIRLQGIISNKCILLSRYNFIVNCMKKQVCFSI